MRTNRPATRAVGAVRRFLRSSGLVGILCILSLSGFSSCVEKKLSLDEARPVAVSRKT